MQMEPAQRVERLFARYRVLDMPRLMGELERSRASIFRDLIALDYLSSYTHSHRYYTLPVIPDFDSDGLWLYEGIGFSKHGLLPVTLRRLVDQSVDGRTHPELKQRLQTRVHNPLLDLVRREQISRERIGDIYLYVSADATQAAEQLAQRQEQTRQRGAVPTWHPSLLIAVLLDVVHSGERRPDPVATRLQAAGVPISRDQVRAIFDHYDLGKKN